MAFSTGFPSTSTAPNFGTFGNTAPVTKATGFGTGGFSFGTPTTATATTSGAGFGFGGFGAAPNTSTTTTTSAAGFGLGTFGAPQTTSSLFSGFGAQPTSTNTGFGGFGGFGAKPTTATTTTTSTGFGGFGGFGASGFGSTFGTGGLGQPQQQQQQQPDQGPNSLEALYSAVFNCNIYGDERDSTLARWNLLQALWGTGKGFYSQNLPPVEFTLHNPLCRFKAIGYSCIPGSENKEGLVALMFNKKEDDIKALQSQLITSLNTVLGNKPTLTLTVESIRPLSETKSQAIIYVQEKGVTGTLRRIPATDLAAYFLQPMQKQQLTQQLSQLGLENIHPQVMPDKDQLDEYLTTAPAGIDPRLWRQAVIDNPNSEKYIPVPMVGFGEVRWRLRCQENETRLHQLFLERVGEDVAALQRRHATTLAKIAEHRRSHVELSHRVLRVLVRQEVSRKLGLALTGEEESLRSRLEALQGQISAPTQFKARLNELLSQMRTHTFNVPNKESERYIMDPGTQEDIKQFLLMEQNGMAHLIDIIQNDLGCLKIMKDGLLNLLQGH